MEASSDSSVKLSPKVSQRRKAAPLSARPVNSNRSRFLLFLLLVLVLCAGLLIGAVIMRVRYNGNNVVVSVNGVTISKNDFYRRLELASGTTVIRQMVDEELRLQFAKNAGVAPTKAQVEAQYNELTHAPDFKDKLALSGQSPEEFKHTLEVSLAAAAMLNKGVKITDQELKEFYERNVDKRNLQSRYYTPESVYISVIITPSEAKCKQALAEFKNGAKWPEVVRKYSKDASKNNNGDLPRVVRGRTRAKQVPGLEDAIFRMKIGETSEPHKYAGAWWLIRCLEKKTEKTMRFEDVTEDCRIQTALLKGIPTNTKNVEEEYQKFQKEAKVQAFWEQYKQALTLK